MSVLQSDAAARRLAAIINSSDDAIISKDLSGIVLSWNAAAQRVFGYTEAEMVGQSILRIIPIDRRGEEEIVLSRIRRGEQVDHFETWRQHKDGSLIPISLTVSPVRDEHGVVVGASKIARDISERRRADALLARSETERADLHRRLFTLVQASQSVVGTPDIEAVLDASLQLARELVTADGYVLWRLDEHERWEAARRMGVSDAFIELDARTASAPTAAPSEALAVEDVWQAPAFAHRLEAYRNEGLVSVLVIPLRINSATRATLAFYYRQPHIFSDVEVQTGMALGNLAAAGIGSAQLHAHERMAREDARQANRIKDQFLATLSHELRTPLNAILGYTRMVLRRAVSPDRHEHALRVVERNASALAQIVEDVLDVSRIVTGKLNIKREPLNLAPLVHQATDTVAPMAEEKGVQVTRQIGTTHALIEGDDNRLQQVIWNLLTNAIKFTPPGGTVTVELTTLEDRALLTVIDTGVGIPPAFLKQIFEPFRQADTRSTREHGGLGLGLAITRRIIELHGGQISARSHGEGTGSRFDVLLPLAPTRTRTH